MKSLMKAFDIMEVFLKGTEEMSVTEISQILGLNKTTVSRIMLKMAGRGYLEQTEKRGKYSLGKIFLEYSGIIKSQLRIREIAMPYLVELSRKVREVAILGIWNGRGSVITEGFHDAAYLHSPLRVLPDEGVTMPLYCTCIGKACLASMTEEKLKEYLKNTRLERKTPNTLTDSGKLIKQLITIREEGVAFDLEEFAVGVKGAAASLTNNAGKLVGSIAIMAPSARVNNRALDKMIPLIKGCAGEISQRLGYHGNAQDAGREMLDV
jgi:IclR family KDG regulon transcriptional repressor